jgi:hypothetical protein
VKAQAEQRARIARVRRVQHLQAAGIAAAAEEKVVQLESNATRLASLRGSLTASPGITSGAALGSAGELASRLDSVQSGLADAIGAARVQAMARAAERLDAHIRREGAEKLETRAVADLQNMIEQRLAASIRHRSRETRNG